MKLGKPLLAILVVTPILFLFTGSKAKAQPKKPGAGPDPEPPKGESLGVGPNGGNLIKLPDGRIVEVPTSYTGPSSEPQPEPKPEPQPAPQPEPPAPLPKFVPKTDEEKELLTKMTRLVRERFGGNWRAAFFEYAGADQRIDEEELQKMLKAANIGYPMTREKWAEAIIGAIDKGGDGMIGWEEFEPLVGAL